MTEYFDWWNGQPTDPQLKDYPIPGAALMPKLHVAFAESYEPSGPFGAKGLGEIGLDADSRRHRERDRRRGGRAHTRIADHRGENPPRAAPGAVREREGGPARGAERRHVGADRLRQTVGRASARPGVRARGERRRSGQAARRRRSGAGLRRHVARPAPRAHRLSAGEAARLHHAHPGVEREISIDARGTLRAGAAVRQQALYDEPRVRQHWRAIDDAMEAVGHTRIRHMLTVGGSLGPLIGGFDLPLALLALGARVTVAGPKGRRTVTLEEAFEKRFAKDEMVVSFEVDAPPARSGSSFFKYMARQVLEIPTVNTAASVTLDADGTCAGARVVRGSGELEADRARPRRS